MGTRGQAWAHSVFAVPQHRPARCLGRAQSPLLAALTPCSLLDQEEELSAPQLQTLLSIALEPGEWVTGVDLRGPGSGQLRL